MHHYRDTVNDPGRRGGVGKEESRKVTTTEKLIRTTFAVVTFGIPLLIGTVGLVGFGILKACKRRQK
jgi:hypothetical protein